MKQGLQHLLWYPGSSLSQSAEGHLMMDRRRRQLGERRCLGQTRESHFRKTQLELGSICDLSDIFTRIVSRFLCLIHRYLVFYARITSCDASVLDFTQL